MALRIQPSELLPEIEDCVAGLKTYSSAERGPINDDLLTLRLFEEKLELILSYGLKEKPGSHGQNTSYWNYVCACLASSKRSHDDITFVKSIASIKTSLGRGRAFIRFCLVQRCLADSLQSCFMEQKISRDFYSEQSLPMQEKLWTSLVTLLYELNDLNFDLSAEHAELDVSWPKFAQKSFTSSENENVLYRNLSTLHMSSVSKKADSAAVGCNTVSCASLDGSSNLNNSISDPVKLNELNKELNQENICLKKDVKKLQEEKLSLLSSIQTLQNECLILQQQLNSSYRDDFKKTEPVQIEEEMEITDVPINLRATERSGNGTSPVTSIVTTEMKGESSSVSTNPSVKPKVKCDSTDSPNCSLQPRANEITTVVSSNFCTCGKGVKTLEEAETSIYIPQNSIYITELLLEIKKVTDYIEDTVQKSDVNSVISYISRLKNIRNCLEAKFLSQCDKSKNSMDFNNFVENCVSCIKNLVTKQESVINTLQEKVDLSIKGNENLYSKTKKLKDLLHSCGFLKIVNEKEIEIKSNLSPTVSASPISINPCDDLLSDIARDPVLKRIVVPLLPVLNSSFEKLSILNERVTELLCCLDSSQELNGKIISKIRAQEMHLRGVSKEIEEAQQLVSVLRKQHQKLQSAEGILKYDLQEKRKLFTRLKQQLENTREDFNQVRIKNSKSEAEWQDLRNEFVQRNKQASEESGFVDDKGIDEHEVVFPNAASDCTLLEVRMSEKDSVSDNSTEEFQEVPPKKSRLELLEEQCQNLYSSLLQNSLRRKDIDKRLENVCKTVQKRNKNSHSSSVTPDLHTENIYEDTNDSVVPTSPELMCQDATFSPDASVSSPHSSPGVGSLNSECSCSLASICNDVNSLDNFCCDSPKIDSSIVLAPCSTDLHTENIFENSNDSVVPSSPEDMCQNIIFPSDAFVSNPHSSPDKDSLNSDCSSCLTSTCNKANSSGSGEGTL